MSETPKPYLLRHQLQESNDRYALVAKATNDVIYDLDIASGIVVWNDALYEKYGFGRNEPVAALEWWTSHIHPDDALRIEHDITSLLESDQDTWQGEYRFRKADGEYAVIRDRAYILRNLDGAPRRLIGSMLDITESAKLNRAKDEFTSLVSHQLRTPLTIIQLYSAMLAEGNFGPLKTDQLEHVERINEASNRLIKLVSDILNISRIEMDRLQLHCDTTNLHDFVADTLEQLKPLAAERSIRFTFKPMAQPPTLPLDRAIFGEVIQNILSNAIRYSRDGGTVTTTISRQPSGYVIAIQDSGIGIPAKDQPHVFERFYRASNAVETTGEGTGLGLYLAKLIMGAVGGDITVASQAGKGSTFYIQLPLAGMCVTAS